jgi:hypothetical protein
VFAVAFLLTEITVKLAGVPFIPGAFSKFYELGTVALQLLPIVIGPIPG